MHGLIFAWREIACNRKVHSNEGAARPGPSVSAPQLPDQATGPASRQAVLAWQQDFYPRWHAHYAALHNAPLQALAWLVDSPELLESAAWQGKIASVQQMQPACDNLACLLRLQELPEFQAQAMQGASQTRLGRYAEKLLGMYFQARGLLYAQGLQVRFALPTTAANGKQGGTTTIGEFDFLLHQQQSLWHWELATKFYLYAPHLSPRMASDYFIGPNLADSLGKKMQKILHQQLNLAQQAELMAEKIGQYPSEHEAYQTSILQLAGQISQAQALVKGWLFYPFNGAELPADGSQQSGLNSAHCRGFWCGQSELAEVLLTCEAQTLQVLPRLAWLAPARFATSEAEVMLASQAQAWLLDYFASSTMPVLFALLQRQQLAGQDSWLEVARVFVVPDDWQARALEMPVRN